MLVSGQKKTVIELHGAVTPGSAQEYTASNYSARSLILLAQWLLQLLQPGITEDVQAVQQACLSQED